MPFWLKSRLLLAPGPIGVGSRLAQLSRASRQLATGDLSARVGAPLVERKDEFGQLAQDMDEMAGRLQVSQQANQRLLRDVSHEPIGLQLESSLLLDADRDLLWRVFENLLRNAMIHSGDAEGIQVTAEKVSGKEIQVCVRDSGPGIAETHIKRVFEPFYRVDETRNRSSGGHGLGLAIAASAVRRHGGRISASNRQAGGLEMKVVLPVKQVPDSSA